jgi:hypothetical protein
MSGASSGNDILQLRIGFTISDILGDRAEKQKGLLKDQSDVLAVFGYR